MVDRLFEDGTLGWNNNGRLKKEIEKLLNRDPPPVSSVDLEAALILKAKSESLAEHNEAMKYFWDLCRRVGCGAYAPREPKEPCPHFFNVPGMANTCKLHCWFEPGEITHRRCEDCNRLIFCNYYSNPILQHLRPFYTLWAGYPYALRRLLVVLSVFGEDGGMRTPGKQGSSYQLTHIAKMAGLNDQRADEKVRKLIQVGVLRQTDGSRPHNRRYRYIPGGSEAAWRNAESEMLRATIRKLVSERRPKSRTHGDFKEGSDYTLIGSMNSQHRIPRVILGEPPPENIAEILTAFAECQDAIWKLLLRRGVAVAAEVPGLEGTFGALLSYLRGETAEERQKGLSGEEEEFQACMNTLRDKVLSKYLALSMDELVKMLDYSGVVHQGKGPPAIVIGPVI